MRILNIFVQLFVIFLEQKISVNYNDCNIERWGVMMYLSAYALEKELVDVFLNYTIQQPLLINRRYVRFFVWGYEMYMRDGRGNNAGTLDLLATDETGEVWLIEAKLCTNAEWNELIWQNQISLYRQGLMTKTELDIALMSRRFLKQQGSSKTYAPFLNREIQGLSEAFEKWALTLGKDLDFGRHLYEQTLQKLQSGDIMETVLSDKANPMIWDSRPKDHYGSAYFVLANEQWQAISERTKDPVTKQEMTFSHKTWAEFWQDRQQVKPTFETVPQLLASNVVPIYEKIIDRLKQLGWNGNVSNINKKAYAIDLMTTLGKPLRIHLGWPDSDGQIAIKYRKPYSYGLKFNIDFRFFKKVDESEFEIWEKGFELVKELHQTANYSYRGKNPIFNDSALAVYQLKWDGEMMRKIDQYNRDYVGREDELADLENALQFLEKYIDKTLINEAISPRKNSSNRKKASLDLTEEELKTFHEDFLGSL